MDASKRTTSMPLLASVGLLWLLTVDLMVRFDLGPISLSGLLTPITAILCITLAPMVSLVGTWGKRGIITRSGGRMPWPLTIFGFYVLIRLSINPSIEGAQNVAVYSSFIAGAAVVALSAPMPSVGRMLRSYRWGAVATVVIFLVALVIGIEVYGERAFALSSLVFLAVLIPHRSRKILPRLAPFLVVLAMFLSLSRTAAVIGAALLVFLALNSRRMVRMPLAVTLFATAGAGIIWAVTTFDPFRDRFLGGDAGLEIGGLSINTSGRANLWGATIDSAMSSPWFGRGAGSAAETTKELFGIGHPHNEYLRIFHDFGWVGLSAFSVGMLMLVYRVWVRARQTDHQIHWAALIGLIGILAASATDNVLTYPFVMFPLAILVGASLAQPSPGKRSSQRLPAGARPVPAGASRP